MHVRARSDSQLASYAAEGIGATPMVRFINASADVIVLKKYSRPRGGASALRPHLNLPPVGVL